MEIKLGFSADFVSYFCPFSISTGNCKLTAFNFKYTN